MKIMEAVKEHPYFTGIGVFIVGLVLILILAGGNKQAATAVVQQPTTDTSAATQLAMSQVAAGVAVAQSNNALSGQMDYDSSTVQIAKINADAQNNHDLNQYNTAIGLATIQAGQAIAVSTIGANLGSHEADLDAATNQAAIAAQAATTINGQNVAGTVAAQNIAAQLVAVQGQQAVDARKNELDYASAISTNYTAYSIAQLDQTQNLWIANDQTGVATLQSNNQLAATQAALRAGAARAAMSQAAN